MGQAEPSPEASARTAIELVAALMEKSFQAMGEGVVMGTMPAYLERFGRDNAYFVKQNFLDYAPTGPTSALGAMNLISRVTGTPFELIEDERRETTKRLGSCEFLDAFEHRSEFPKTMICMLHRAAYQGSVNGLLEQADFDVDVRTRILFGAESCDFAVTQRSDSAVEDHDPAPGATIPRDQVQWLSLGFYTFILSSFVDYLTTHLPQERVAALIDEAAHEVGEKVYALMEATDRMPSDAAGAARAVLTMGGRTFGTGLNVVGCPQAQHIIDTTKPAAPDLQRRVRENACALCHHLVDGAVSKQAPGCKVTRTQSLALGDDRCNFAIEEG